MSHAGAAEAGLLVLVDPVARRFDGESVRIAKDVLSAGAEAKICLPEGPEEFARALARRGHRRPVVVGDDRALARAVALLHRDRELREEELSLIPVGSPGSLAVARSLGVPASAVQAARAVLDGAVRRLDLLVDDSDGVVLRGLRIPAAAGVPVAGTAAWAGAPSVWSACRSLVRTLVRPPVGSAYAAQHRLRVEADGELLSDVDRLVRDVSVASREGFAEVVVRTSGGGRDPVTARARTVTVSGADFRYRADHRVTGPVRRRTWTLQAGAWGLTVPR
ncbi:diacylglycerol kinase [Streptomyces sp. NRRL S-87]|uniref:diacylglycerol kinase n=1 Tax=Streptomyces sp. NRRL S-87 TaxID=1463920 RepID=UPI0004BEAD0A|nr:diacylglycerol kinase [Streptomyces sp. NRRL S-87]